MIVPGTGPPRPEVDIPGLTIDGLRRTHATLTLRAGAHSRVERQRLEHANVAFTLPTYDQMLPEMEAAAAGKFAQMFS